MAVHTHVNMTAEKDPLNITTLHQVFLIFLLIEVVVMKIYLLSFHHVYVLATWLTGYRNVFSFIKFMVLVPINKIYWLVSCVWNSALTFV